MKKFNIKEWQNKYLSESVSKSAPKLGKAVKNIRDVKVNVDYTIHNETSISTTWITDIYLKEIESGKWGYTFIHRKEGKMAIMLDKKDVINYIKNKKMFFAK